MLFDKMFWMGMFAGAAWFSLNIFFLFRLMKMAVATPAVKNKKKIPLLLILKFPALYLTGFFILKSRIFPVAGILAGLTLSLVGLGVYWVYLNAGLKQAEGRA